jgi:hypothetical protein
MGKGKNKKDGGSSTQMVTTIAVTGGVFLLRKLLATAWTKITGEGPAHGPDRPEGHAARGTGVVRRHRHCHRDRAVRHRALHDAEAAGRHGR